MKRLLIGSTNRGKLAEIRALLQDLELDLVEPGQVGLSLEVEEDGATYAENAGRKAEAFARASGLLTLADDSGLEVDALGGQPGIRSARFAPQPGATDADRRAYLLARLSGLPRPWTARFRCVVAVAGPDGPARYAEGVCEGEIIPTEHGTNGFGYDPIFWIPDQGGTMAELSMEAKNRISHRARAIQAARRLLANADPGA